MNIQAEKYNLIHRIVNLQDSQIIGRLKEVLNSLTADSKDWYEELNVSEKNAIQKSIEQADAGNLISNADVLNKVDSKIRKLKNQ